MHNHTASINIEWQETIPGHTRPEIEDLLRSYNIKQKFKINLGAEPLISADNELIEISVNKAALEDKKIQTAQINSLLYSKKEKLNLSVNLPDDMFWEYVREIQRHIAIFHGVMHPQNNSTKEFSKLITNMKKEFKDKNVLELGTGSGVLTILLARYGAKVIATDVVEKAVENAKLNLKAEEKQTRELVRVGKSNLYDGLEEITGKPAPKFDYLFFNNPVMLGEPKAEDPNSFNSYAGNSFRTIKETLSYLPDILKPAGCAYFLVMDLPGKVSSIWTNTHMEKSLPHKWLHKPAIKPINFDSTHDFRFSIHKVFRSA